ncbi:hypothetical protein [Actinoplanes subglobosus]|uniref:Uncharacterized protein n=1 Tax=Actinoplanes subglobosus TaxID=1547892 RepID=A0ABV8IS62_9ACTN
MACELLPLSPLEITGESVVVVVVELDVLEVEEVDVESDASAATPIPTAVARLATTSAPVTSAARLRPMSRCM